jgi:hypothetical protein
MIQYPEMASINTVLENGADDAIYHDVWFFPAELRQGLEIPDLPEEIIEESLACAWEYSRCVIPQWTNWDRFLAFNRTIVIAVIAEFRGDLIPQDSSKDIVGYNLEKLLTTLFGETSMYEAMSCELRAFLLISAEKSSKKLSSELFSRYLNALVRSPQSWFRLRDCDALARYTIASALACNDLNDTSFNENQWQLIAELGNTLYDAVAFYKHRAEGETNSTFGYVGGDVRKECFRLYREVLWALDVVWARDPAKRCVLNFTRFFGGPIHMTTRRYRFVEDGLMIGRPETEQVVVEETLTQPIQNDHYAEVIEQSEKLMFPGLCELLQSSAFKHCLSCSHAAINGSKDMGQFGGVQLCDKCKQEWRRYMQEFPMRFATAFPEVAEQLVRLERPALK